MPKTLGKTIVITGHSENPPVEKLTDILTGQGFKPHVVRTPFGEPLPNVDDICGTIILGGPSSITKRHELDWLQREIDWAYEVKERRLPMFGICLGCQMLAHIHGEDVTKGGVFEFGFHSANLIANDPIFGNELKDVLVFQAHGDTYTLGDKHTRLMTGELYPEQAVRFCDKHFGVQFHPEISANVIFRWLRSIKNFGVDISHTAQEEDEIERLAAQHLPKTHVWLEAFLGRLFK